MSEAKSVKEAQEAVLNLGEYSRDEFIEIIQLSGVDKNHLEDIGLSNKFDLLKALNCIKPLENGRYIQLYHYRCVEEKFRLISQMVIKDPYILSFVHKNHIPLALNVLVEYSNFLSNLQSIGFPVDVGAKEKVLNISGFLKEGGLSF